jgi:hypothetical protein
MDQDSSERLAGLFTKLNDQIKKGQLKKALSTTEEGA